MAMPTVCSSAACCDRLSSRPLSREQHVRALADVRLREEQRNQWDWMALERWASLTDCTQLQLAARAVATLVRAEGSTAQASVWSERWGRVLRASGWPGERTPSSIEFQTIAKFHDVLAQFGTLDAMLGPIPRTTALQRLRELTRETSFEAQSGPAAVTVIDMTTVAGMQFDALWVAGLDASRLPAPPDPDPLLPIEVQRAAGMPEASARGMLQLGQRQLERLDSQCARRHSELAASGRRCRTAAQSAAGQHSIADTGRIGVGATAEPSAVRTAAHPADARRSLCTAGCRRSLPRGGSQTIELQSRCAFRAQAQLRLHALPLSVVSLGHRTARARHAAAQGARTAVAEIGKSAAPARIERDPTARVTGGGRGQTAATTLQATTRVAARLADLEVRAIVLQLARSDGNRTRTAAVHRAQCGAHRTIFVGWFVHSPQAGPDRWPRRWRRPAGRLQAGRIAQAESVARFGSRPTTQAATAAVCAGAHGLGFSAGIRRCGARHGRVSRLE